MVDVFITGRADMISAGSNVGRRYGKVYATRECLSSVQMVLCLRFRLLQLGANTARKRTRHAASALAPHGYKITKPLRKKTRLVRNTRRPHDAEIEDHTTLTLTQSRVDAREWHGAGSRP